MKDSTASATVRRTRSVRPPGRWRPTRGLVEVMGIFRQGERATGGPLQTTPNLRSGQLWNQWLDCAGRLGVALCGQGGAPVRPGRGLVELGRQRQPPGAFATC